MAAGFFSGVEVWDLSSTASPRRRRWATRRGEVDADEGPAVLVLSHFSRPPFLSFSSLRLGASRTRLLGIENPNAEDVEVTVDRFPASARGFSIEHRRFSVQSGERIFVSITWTPLEEGKVRELVTFTINGTVKHQAVLLGVAEQPLKKKKSLWDTIKKKKSSETSASIKVKNVNKTFEVSQKVDKLRSPLQPCENQNTEQAVVSLGNDSFVGSENKLPISPITPVLEEQRTTVCTPCAMRRSTTFSDIAAASKEELLPEIKTCVKKFVNEHSELKFEGAYSNTELAQLPASNNEVIPNCSLSPVCTLEHSTSMPVLCTRRILSPDSFVNDSYQVDIDIIKQPVSILSPDQFVKENLADKQAKTPKCEASLISSTAETYVVKKFLPPKCKKNGDVETKTRAHIEHNFSEAFEICNGESQILHDDKPKDNHFSFPSTEELQTRSSSQREQPKKRPVLSATVVKNKPNAAEETRMETLQPKSKKCLNKAIMGCADGASVYAKAEIQKHLPVIGPISAESKCHDDKVNPFPPGLTSLCRKRKSEVQVENRVTAPVYVEEVERKRTLKSSMDNKAHTTVRPSTFKTTNRERIGQRKQAGSSRRKAAKTTNRVSKPIPGLAQSHLTFVKPLKTVIPRHPMPFAAKNMFYDERWKEKQQRGFTWWLNFILTPDDFSVKANTLQVNAAALILGEENHHKTSVPKAPTKDEASLKAYTAHQKLNKLRREACRLFTSEAMVRAIRKLEVEIETRRLLVRRDRHLWKDLGERQKVLNWLLSYNPLWLRIGLETVYGEVIALESNSDVTGLAVFILNRLLWNPDIAAEYRHPTVPHLYREGHEEALSKFTLKKLLLLVCFLDCAKQSRMIDHDPCLFCKDAEFKASKDLLLAFSRDFLSGEGDLSRHLGFLGLPVSHVQTPLDEFDFAVTNLAVDLHCGVRLVRTMELLTKNWDLSKQLRVPAISRLQKIHNVDIVLNVLKERGILLKDGNGSLIDSKDIVDRHRERTLALLWKIVFAFQVDVFLNVEQLKEEIEFLKNTHKRKIQLSALKTSASGRGQEDNSSNSSSPSYSESVNLLMEWVNAVCVFYNVKVENFTVCFSDGRVLCHLIHHYHPCYVPLEAVCQRTTQTVEYSKSHTLGLNSSSSSSESDTSLSATEGMSDGTVTASILYKELLDNEKKNFQLISAAVSDLGGIPAMIHHSDMSNTIPDEKVVVTYLSFLCSRLLDLRQEARAARLIQSAWRNYRLKRELKLSKERDRAARIIQKAAIKFLSDRRILKRVNAAVFIQKHWKRYLARMKFLNLKKTKLEEARTKSATLIQAYWRRYSARKRYLQLRYYVIFVQARIRMARSVAAYKQIAWAALKIQSHLCAYKLAKRDRQRYETLKSSALIIQSAFRRWRQYKIQQKTKAVLVLQTYFRKWQSSKLARRERAALLIQSWYRMHRDLKQYLHIKQSVVKIQAWYRCQLARRAYQEHRTKIVILQQYYRAYKLGKIEREYYLQKRAAVIILQAAFRRMKKRKLFRQTKAVCVDQSLWRMEKERLRLLQLKKSVTALQSHVRKHYKAGVVCQKQWQEYLQLHNSVVHLQAMWRGRTVRKAMVKEHRLATVIQSYYRMHMNQMKYKKLRQATLVIQKYFRAYCMKKKKRAIYLQTKAAVLVLQSAYRGMTVRKQLNKLNKAATTIQAAFKSYLVKKDYERLRSAAIVVQRRYRATTLAKCQKQKYLSLKKAIVQLQAVYRGVRVRRQIHCMHQAAVCIQATFKMHRMKRKYQAMTVAAIIIQRQYTAFCVGRVQRKRYLELKKSVIILQAACRGMKIRQDLKIMNQSAAIIQSYYRMHKQQRNFRRLLLATRSIQQWFRACKERNAQVHNYVVMRSATLRIQAAFRGRKTRQLLRTMSLSAELIQRRFRAFLQRKHFLSIKTAAIVIQRKYRATKLAKTQHQKYLSILNATVLIQSAYKGSVVRKQMQQMHHAAAVIQATFRMHKTYISYQALRLAVVIIQQRYCAYREGKRAREAYLKLYNSILVLQAAYRGMKTRHFLKTRHKAALTIQRNYRMYREYCHYRKVQWATQVIQKRYRANKLKKIAVQHYSSLKRAAACIQRAFREMQAKKHHRERHCAAVVVQKNFKGFRERQRYLSLKAASLVFQRRYRALILSRQCTLEYLSLRRAAIHIQAVYRGVRVRKSIEQMHLAASTIQSAYKRHRSRRYCQNIRIAAVVIQNYYRSYAKGKEQRKKYLTMKSSALVIQASYRGMKERQKLKTMHVSATIIQSIYRRYIQRRCYKQLCWAIRVIQQRFRAKMAKEADMENYIKIKKAAICLQSSFRARKARQLYKINLAARRIQSFLKMRVERRRFLDQRAAAILIQSMFRCQRTRTRYKLIQSSAVAIQRWYRACHRTHLQKAEYSALRQAIVIIQSAFRGMKARKTARQLRAARKIQSFLQMAVQRRKFIQLRTAAIRLKAYYLMYKTESQYTSCRKAAVVLQRCYRSHLTVKYQRMAYLQTQRNIIIVQATVRGFIERKRFHKIKESTIKIQAFFRGFIERQKYLQYKVSAVLIQQHYRAHQMRNTEQQRYHQKKRAAIRIQASYRGYKTRQWVNKIRAAQLIQAWFRGHRARKEYGSVVKATRVIQSHFRTKQQRNWFLKIKLCALSIQRRWRATLTARIIRHQFLTTKNAAVKIQLAYTQYRARRLLRKKYQAACLIQKTYRGFRARRKFVQQKAAAVIIQKRLRAWQEGRFHVMLYNKTIRAIIKLQAFIRGYLVRKKISEQKQKNRLLHFTAAAYHHSSAIKIQRAYRIHLMLELAQKQISSVLIIQRWFRAIMQQKRFQRDYQRVIQLQRAIRGWLEHRNAAATVIQRSVRRFVACRRRRRFAVGIIKFQALWRGYSWRKNNDTAKTKALRCSLEKANENSREENKLCNRTEIAIEYLLKYKHLSFILAALQHLEVATRLSAFCCENMAQTRAIFTIFVLIRSCNRSVPCMDVIRYSIQVLLNVSKYEKTTQAVYEVENSIDTLLDLLQMYRGKAGDKISEKGGSIFTKTCCLLAILSKDSKRAMEIRSMPRVVTCIQSLCKLTARKHQMDVERTLVRQKTSNFFSGTSFVPVTSLRIKTVSRIKPDWVLRKDNVQEVVDPLQAILMVADTLGIACS